MDEKILYYALHNLCNTERMKKFDALFNFFYFFQYYTKCHNYEKKKNDSFYLQQ